MSKIQKLRDKAIKFQNLEEQTRQVSRTLKSKAQLANDYLAVIGKIELDHKRILGGQQLLDKEAKRLNDIKVSLDLMKISLLRKEEDFAVLAAQWEEEKKKELKAIREYETLAKNKLVEASALEQKVKNDTDIALGELKSLESRLEANKEVFNSTDAYLRTQIDARNAELTKVEQRILEQTKILEMIEAELERTILANKSEEQRIKDVLNSLEERTTSLTKKENNLLILKGRLQRVLDRVYPGQNINNLV